MLYNCSMSARNWRRLFGILILLVSLGILLWGIWPYADLTRSTPIQPGELQLPTPDALRFLILNV